MIDVVDTHVHLWRYASPLMSWLVDRPPHWDVVRRDFAWPDLREVLDRAGISNLILVQACPTPEETQWLLDVAAHREEVLGVVGWVTLTSGAAAETSLDAFGGDGRRKLVGIRNNHCWAPDGDVLATASALDAVRLLAERRLPLDLHFPDYTDLPVAVRLIDAVPDNSYIINHLGKPVLDDPDAFEPWARSMEALSRHPRVYLKYSGWTTFVRRTEPSDVRRYVEFALEHFGPARIMFGSNWPVALVAGEYGPTYRATLDALGNRASPELRQILRETALRCYRPDLA